MILHDLAKYYYYHDIGIKRFWAKCCYKNNVNFFISTFYWIAIASYTASNHITGYPQYNVGDVMIIVVLFTY